MNTRTVAILVYSMLFAGGASDAQAQPTYVIQSGSTYTYRPSNFRVGLEPVPACAMNENRQCDLIIGGSFTLDESGGVASILDANLTLSNDDDPKLFFNDELSTSEGVEEWLESRTLELLPAGAPGTVYADTAFPTFVVSVVGDTATLTGGFQLGQPSEIGVDFAVTAFAIPEPATVGLLAGAFLLAGSARCRP